MKTATKVRDLDGFTGDAALYKLSETLCDYTYDGEPMTGYEYVVVSAATTLGVETYIFDSDKNGKILSSSELPGSIRGVYDHTVALNHAGYEVNE